MHASFGNGNSVQYRNNAFLLTNQVFFIILKNKHFFKSFPINYVRCEIRKLYSDFVKASGHWKVAVYLKMAMSRRTEKVAVRCKKVNLIIFKFFARLFPQSLDALF